MMFYGTVVMLSCDNSRFKLHSDLNASLIC